MSAMRTCRMSAMRSSRRHLLTQGVFRRPRCLISYQADGSVRVDQNVLYELSQISQPLVIVTIAGSYRTGKSFLLNRLADAYFGGFLTRNTIKPVTKGIWIWCRKHPTQDNTVLALLDTEGLGDVNKGDSSHDNRILCLAVLMSDVLCYNMFGVLDNDALDKLALASAFSNISGKGKSLFQHRFPELVLCLRDFFLEMRNEDGPLTEDEYLEECLKLKSEDDAQTEKYNDIRSCIKKTFVKRKCFTFDRPGDRKAIARDELEIGMRLQQSFVNDVSRFATYIYHVKPKMVYRSRNGKTFSDSIKGYIDAISGVPDIQDVFTQVAMIENTKLLEKTVQQYRLQLHSLPMQRFDESSEKLIAHSIKQLKRDVVDCYEDGKDFENEAREKMRRARDVKLQENLEKMHSFCYSKISRLYKDMVGPCQYYLHEDGFSEYRLGIRRLKETYMRECKHINTEQKLMAYVQFLDENAYVELQILYEDYKLSKQLHERRISRLKANLNIELDGMRRRFECKLLKDKEAREQIWNDERKILEESEKQMDKQASSILHRRSQNCRKVCETKQKGPETASALNRLMSSLTKNWGN